MKFHKNSAKKNKFTSIFSDMPTLTTERLTLRPMKISDAYDMNEYASREDVTEYLLWSPHPSLWYTRDYLALVEKRYTEATFYDWAIVLTESGKMIGTAGFTRLDLQNNSGEIGYVLNPEYCGKGYATEAASRVLRFGFETLLLHRIEARFMKGNDASRHIMEKLGMTFEGYRRDEIFVKGKFRTVGYCAAINPNSGETS